MISSDLRTRIVDAYSKDEGSMRELAERFSVSFNTVFRSVQRVRTLGTWVSGKLGGNRMRRVSEEGEVALRQWLGEQPALTLTELCALHQKHMGIPIPVSTMGQTLKRMGLTRKKRSYMASINAVKTHKNLKKRTIPSVRTRKIKDFDLIDKT